MQKTLLAELQPGQIRKGVVKDVTELCARVDLGGVDGLMHVNDMSWGGRRPALDCLVHVDQEIEVYILSVDREREKVALGWKHKTPEPWLNVDDNYPVGSKHKGEVVSVMTFGAFVKLEPGMEGLVRITEMSWTRRINHPSELVQIGDVVEVQVLAVNKNRQEITLGMNQVLPKPGTR